MQRVEKKRNRSSILRAAAFALAVSAPLVLAGCTLTPVYGDAAAARSELALNYAEPSSRLEQIVYQTLSARLRPGDAGAPTLSATVSSSASRTGLADVASPMTDRQITVTINYSVTRDGTVVTSGRRDASVGYQTSGQYLADDSARAGAQEQAARAAAENVRLALIAALAPQ